MIHEEDIREENLRDVAKKMLLAARTAPKAKGIDNLVLALCESSEIKKISEHLLKMGKEIESPAFIRDAENILKAPVMVILGTKLGPVQLKKCGMCGFENCVEKDKHPHIPCVYNSGDLGIAIGSAARVAMDHLVDNRIMYTVGQAIMDMKLLGPDVKICYAIPLSCSGKSPFFDRPVAK